MKSYAALAEFYADFPEKKRDSVFLSRPRYNSVSAKTRSCFRRDKIVFRRRYGWEVALKFNKVTLKFNKVTLKFWQVALRFGDLSLK